MKKTSFLLLMLFLVIPLAACGEEPATATEAPIPITTTPDLCSEANLPTEVEKVNAHMREFDDYAALASNTPQAQLVTVIPELQRVLRESEDQEVPPCLTKLKEMQINHMKVVVQTLLAFVGNSDASVVNTGIAKSRELHSQYDIEIARLLGLTLTIATAVPATQVVEPTATPYTSITNPGPNELNLRTAPDFNAPATSVLKVGDLAIALGRTADNQWIMVQLQDQPDKNVWVYATVVQLSAPIETLPVITP